ncbi:MAG TPA: hypothetical protein VKY19_29715 [Ktedonosporobacter sp.]|nr:hypothetical protein [Ktedonosporobacter sp.]
MEKYIERGIDEGQLHTVEELTHFLGLQREMVQKILNFLATLGHVTRTNTGWHLTPLGLKSVREGTRYVAKEKRTKLYFDAYFSYPLRKEHYYRKVRIFTPDEATEFLQRKTWGYRFYPISNVRQWHPQALQELEARIDKGDYNIPPEMHHIQALGVQPAYMPMYIIESKKPTSNAGYRSEIQPQRPYYLVYTGIRGLRDAYFEGIINNSQAVYAALCGEKELAPSHIWREWLAEKDIRGVFPLERADGTWQVSLSTADFEGPQAKFALIKVGDYDLRQGYFIQLWCDNKVLRRKAALERALKMVKSQQKYLKRQTLEEQLQLLSKQLQVSELGLADLRQRAVENKMSDLIKILDNLR